MQLILLILYAPTVPVMLYDSEALHMRLLQCESMSSPGTKSGCGGSGVFLFGVFWICGI